MTETTFQNKCNILSELWMNYRHDQNFEQFISYNDLGLPLAYILSSGIANATEASERFIQETFTLLLSSLEVDDTCFETLDDIFMSAN
jgi:hypothetical protein